MTFLLDTDTCVFWLRGRPTVRARLAAVGPETIGVSTITLAELRYGAECSSQPAANHQAIDDFIGGVTVVGVDSEVARAFGEIKAHLRRQGNLIEDFDLLLAATALAHGMTLITNNTEHYGRIAQLTLENWTQP
jgi:tRNA(fMet)-specific endonuclease VapC